MALQLIHKNETLLAGIISSSSLKALKIVQVGAYDDISLDLIMEYQLKEKANDFSANIQVPPERAKIYINAFIDMHQKENPQDELLISHWRQTIERNWGNVFNADITLDSKS